MVVSEGMMQSTPSRLSRLDAVIELTVDHLDFTST
jgi:hypothetical protein